MDTVGSYRSWVMTSESSTWDVAMSRLMLSKHDLIMMLESMAEEPMPQKGLRALCQMADATHFRDNVINPLMRDGYVAPTRPSVPTSPAQKYFLTQKGEALLDRMKQRKG